MVMALAGLVVSTLADAALADPTAITQDLLAKGLWSAGRKAELEGEFGLAAMNYFRAYHLYDHLFREMETAEEKDTWSEKKIQAYSDGLSAIRQYERLRGVRVDVKQLLDLTKPRLITPPKPTLKDKLPPVTLAARPLPVDVTAPPEEEGKQDRLFGIEKRVQMPFGGEGRSELIVRGRKFIGWTASSTRFKKSSELRKNTKDVKVDQQLQIQISGDVAFQFQEALTVNVRFDDAEQDQNQKQAISIKFDPKKDINTPLGVMRPIAEFGDVNLKLEGTSYAAYNKSLFGLTAALTFDRFHIFNLFRAEKFSTNFVATQTKGISAHKEFTGQNTLTVSDIPDITYIPRVYYDVLAEKSDAQKSSLLPIKVGSEQIFRDDRNSFNNTANTLTNKTVTNQGASFKGDFDALVSGQDYFIDYQLGIIQFKSAAAGNAVLAVSLTTADGVSITDKMIKDENTTDTFKSYELKNRYSLGSTNIIRNDPDFIIQIRDLNGKSFFDADSNNVQDPAAEKSYNEIFGLDAQPLDGRTDEKNIDFDFGILRFPDSTPFITENTAFAGRSNVEIYSISFPTTKYKIHVEFVQKTNIYLLNPGIVKGSEIIYVDGVKLSRDQDYFIDYTSGFLQFLRPELITTKSLIVVDYEYFPFTSKSNQTLIGTSLKMTVSPNVSWAATFVSNFDDKPNERPKVNEEPKKVEISDFLINVNPLGMVREGLGNFTKKPIAFLNPFNLSFSFENASSRFNYNTHGEAILSDFEDAGLITQLGSSQNQWRPEIPDGFDTGGRGDYTITQIAGVGHLDNQANVNAEDLRDQASLKVGYTFATTGQADTYVSLSFHISDVTQDLSKRTFLEFWVNDANNPDVTLDMGILNEDGDNDGLLDSEDGNKDNLLNSGEDAGIDLGLTNRIGTGNGILDSEDRDKDGTLDVDQAFFRAVLSDSAVVETKTFDNGWKRYQVFLNTLVENTQYSNQKADLKAIKDLRLTFSKPAGSSATSGSLLINDISIQGVSWEDDNFKDTKTFTVGVVSSRTDPSFTPPPEIVGNIPTLDAKALALSYSSMKGQHVTQFLPAADIRLSLYKKLNFWVKPADATNFGDTFVFRFGPDAGNFFEKSVLLTTTDWTAISINLEEIEETLIKLNIDTSPPFNKTTGGIRYSGGPTLDRIRYLGAGVVSNGIATNTRIYLDEVTVKEVEEERGRANRSAFSSSMFSNLITLNGNREITDNTFRPIGRINYTGTGDYVPEDRRTEDYSGTLNFSRFTFLDRLLKLSIPVSFSNKKAKTFINPDLVENVKRSDLGDKTSDGKSLGFSVSRNSYWPSFGASWSKQEDNVNQKLFKSKQENTSKSYSTNYGYTVNKKILWIIPIGNTFAFNTNYSRSISTNDRDILLGSERNSYQKSQSDGVGFNIHYTITRWFDWTIAINQSLSRQTQSETQPLKKNGRSRSYSWGWPFPPFAGFSPNLNWSLNYSEGFNNESELKNIGSSGSFGASLGLQPHEWWKRLKFLTISYAYNISGSASYQNVPDQFGLSAVFDDFYRNILFFWKGGSLEVLSDTLVLARNSANVSRGHSIGGGISIWKSLSTNYSTAFNRNEVQSLNSIDVSDAFSFNLNNNLDLRTASRLFRGVNSASISYTYGFSSSANKTTENKNISNGLTWSMGWTDRMRTSMGYTFGFNAVKDRLSISKGQGQTGNFSMSYLLSNPFKMTTFTGNLLRFQNRLELLNAFNWSNTKNQIDGVKKTDNMTYGGNVGINYDLRENFRIAAGGTYTVTSNEITPDDDKSVTALNATAELRF